MIILCKCRSVSSSKALYDMVSVVLDTTFSILSIDKMKGLELMEGKREGKAEVKNRISKSKVAGVILAAIELILSFIVVGMVLYTKMVTPVQGIIGAILLCVIPILVVFMMKYKKARIPGIVIASIFILFLGIAIYYLAVTNKALDKITGNNTEVAEIKVYVAKEDDVNSINEAVDKSYVFGKLAAVDAENVNETIDSINKDLSVNIEVKEFDSLIEMLGAFEGGYVQAMIANTAVMSSLDETEGYEDYTTEKLKTIMENKVKKDVVKETAQDPDRFCMYFSGIDTFGGVNAQARSDVNIIAVVNNDTKQIVLISTPRDYYVDLPAVGNKKDKLTHAGIYGINASMDALEQLYDTDISYYVRVNFTGFQNIVDQLGGIDVYSEYAFTSITEEGTYSYSEGENHLNGEQALGFARCRMAFRDGDRQRGRNQMEVIKAIVKKMQSSQMLTNYAGVMDGMSDSFQTDMDKNQIGKLVQDQLQTNSQWTIITYSVSGSDSSQVCASVGQSCYVMVPFEEDVNYAKDLINRNLNNETITQEEVDNFRMSNSDDDVDTGIKTDEELAQPDAYEDDPE